MHRWPFEDILSPDLTVPSWRRSYFLFESWKSNLFLISCSFKKIESSIYSIGFENTANIYGISDSSKNGGLIGWINETQVANEFIKKINNINIGEFTKPIKITNGYLILKLNDKKEIKEKLDIEKELNKLINIEKTKQLNSFSIIFYKRLKQNITINEY